MSKNEKTALVVEDEPELRGLIETFLGFTDYKRVIAAEGVGSGLQAMRNNGPNIDLVILDMNYRHKDLKPADKGNGLYLYKEIQRQGLGPNTGYIFMSGYPNQELAVEAKKIIGEENFIEKPFKVPTFIEVVNRGGYKPQKPLDTIASEPSPTTIQ